MKTTLFRWNSVIILIGMAINVSAQPVQQKLCIKIDKITNGKIIKIDTCFTGASQSEIGKQLKAMGIYNMEDINELIDSVKSTVDRTNSGADSIQSEVVVINDDKDSSLSDGKMDIVSGKNGYTLVMGNNKDVYVSADANNDSSIRTEIIVKGGSNDSENKTKIYVCKKTIEIKSLSDSNKLKSRTGVGNEIKAFSGLKIYPNPAEATLTISYNSSNSESLHINMYDENGKTVYTDNIKEAEGGEVNKIISLSAFTPGIYFVNLKQGNQNETEKIIVE
jgi:Secretion system C-terminal sorting domain